MVARDNIALSLVNFAFAMYYQVYYAFNFL